MSNREIIDLTGDSSDNNSNSSSEDEASQPPRRRVMRIDRSRLADPTVNEAWRRSYEALPIEAARQQFNEHRGRRNTDNYMINELVPFEPNHPYLPHMRNHVREIESYYGVDPATNELIPPAEVWEPLPARTQTRRRIPGAAPRARAPTRVARRKDCDGEDCGITLEPIDPGQGIRLDNKCYDRTSLIQWFSTKGRYEIPHSRRVLTDAEARRLGLEMNGGRRGRSRRRKHGSAHRRRRQRLVSRKSRH